METKLAVLSLFCVNYKELADLTLGQNSKEYCDKHGYLGLCRSFLDEFEGRSVPSLHRWLGFEKVKFVLEAFEQNPKLDWAWFRDCDLMVTNMNFKVGDYFQGFEGVPTRTVLLSSDRNGPNCGSMAVRNSPEAKRLMRLVLEMEPDKSVLHEQHALTKLIPIISSIQVLPQRVMNSYDYSIYTDGPDYPEGQWKQGDFVVHWPGRTLEQRIQHYHDYDKEVVR